MFQLRPLDTGLEDFYRAIERLGNEKTTRQVYRKVINRRGAAMRRAALRFLPGQTGLEKATIRKALGKPRRASVRNLSYHLTTKGGFIAYKYFGAYETPAGVVAFPRGKHVLLTGHFMRGGRFPNRKDLHMHGQVFKPIDHVRKWGRDFRSQKSDVRIPDEMVQGETREAYDNIAKGLPREIEREIMIMMGRI